MARSDPAWVASCTRRSKSASFPAVVWMSTSSGTFSPAFESSAALTAAKRRGGPEAPHPGGGERTRSGDDARLRGLLGRERVPVDVRLVGREHPGAVGQVAQD